MKTYDVPEEVKTLLEKSAAAATLRDIYANLPFGFRKARKCAIDYIKYRRIFWNKVYEMYPELPDNAIYNVTMGLIEVKD